jgi:hypothetical protein
VDISDIFHNSTCDLQGDQSSHKRPEQHQYQEQKQAAVFAIFQQEAF